MNKMRLVITSVISIILVSILMIGSTYAIFTKSVDVDENANVYTTGSLDVTYTLSEDNIKLTDIEPLSLENANTSIPYRVTVTNTGNVPYQFDVYLDDTTASDVIDYKYIMTKVGYLEPKALSECTDNIIKESVIVSANSSVDLDVRIWISDMIQNTEIGKSFFGKLRIDGKAIYDDNTIENALLSLRYMKGFTTEDDNSYFKDNVYREKIKNAAFVKHIDTDEAIVSWDMSLKGDNSVVAWLENNKINDEYYDLYIGSNEVIYAQDLAYFFHRLFKLETIYFDNLDTSLTTNMYGMFSGISGDDLENTSMIIENLDLSKFNTKNVTNMGFMFYRCTHLVGLDLSGFDTSNVTSMQGMFYDCLNLKTLDVGKFVTSNVTNMRSMFAGGSDRRMSLAYLDVSNFDTSKVTDMYMMFQNCYKLTELDVSDFNTSQVTDMKYMFFGCSGLTKLDVSNFDTSKVTDMGYMFGNCSSLSNLDVGSFNTSNVTNMEKMFVGCSNLKKLEIKNFDTSNVTAMDGMFQNCAYLTTTITISNDNVTYTSIFEGAAIKNEAKITVNYIGSIFTLISSMLETKSDTSNVVMGSEI